MPISEGPQRRGKTRRRDNFFPITSAPPVPQRLDLRLHAYLRGTAEAREDAEKGQLFPNYLCAPRASAVRPPTSCLSPRDHRGAGRRGEGTTFSQLPLRPPCLSG